MSQKATGSQGHNSHPFINDTDAGMFLSQAYIQHSIHCPPPGGEQWHQKSIYNRLPCDCLVQPKQQHMCEWEKASGVTVSYPFQHETQDCNAAVEPPSHATFC